ncbi:MAG TPA: glycosyltransferase family 2 protein [Candidatus Acidoferrum sp.]|nr:glycosyltransferase family 2 protein [Candidatus Acidoferrum sp.]
MSLFYSAYLFIYVALALIYIISIIFLLAFRLGYREKYHKEKEDELEGKGLEVSVIMPIYNEATEMIKGALETLKNQKGIKINLIAVIKLPREGQIPLIESYSKVLKSVKVILQKGKPSHNEAFIIGLKEVRTRYTCIMCSDAKIKGNSLVRLLGGLERTGKEAAFGNLYPEISSTLIGRFTAISKIYKQNLTLKGRNAVGFGCYIPGAFAVYRTALLRNEFKHLMANNFIMHDLGLTLRLSAHGYDKLYFIPDVVGTELEKHTFKGWILQHARWFMGTLGLIPEYLKIFSSAKIKIRIGTFGILLIWIILPFALFSGILISIIGLVFGLKFFELYVVTYAILTCIIFTLPDARAYGALYCLLEWFFSSLATSLGILASAYGFIFAKYYENKTYILFKR